MMILTDDATSFQKVYFLAIKNAERIIRCIKEYQAEGEWQTGKRLKQLHFDNRKEFLNSMMQAWYKNEGIIVDPETIPYDHAGNSVPERTHQTVLDDVWILLNNSGLPPSLWANPAATSVFICNLVPTWHHPGKIPAELWTRKRQNVPYLCFFGCNAYTKVSIEKWTSKLHPTSIKCTLIGYYSKGAYKLLNRMTSNIIKSRHVYFEKETGHTTNKEPTPVLSPDELSSILRFNDLSVYTVPISSIDEEDSQIWKQSIVAPRIHVEYLIRQL